MLNIFYEDNIANKVFWKKINKELFGGLCILKGFKKIKDIVPLIYDLPDNTENNNLIIELEAGYFDLYVDDAINIKNACEQKGVRLIISELESIEEAILSCGYTEALCQNDFDLIEYQEAFADLSAFLCENEDKGLIKAQLLSLCVKLGLCVKADMSNRELSRKLIGIFRQDKGVLSEEEFFSDFIDNLLQSMEVFGIEKKWLCLEQCSEFVRGAVSFSQMKEMASRYKNLNSLIKTLLTDNELFKFKGGYKMEPEILKESLDGYFKGLYSEKISPVLEDNYFEALMGKFRETAILSFARAYFKSREKILTEYGSKIFNQGMSERDVFSVFKEWNTEYIRYILYEKAEKEELDG